MWRERAKDGGVVPVTGFPRVDDGDKAKEGQRAPTIRAWSKHEHLVHRTCIRSRAVVSGLYLRSVRYRSVSGTSREVVVLVGRSGSSCTRFVDEPGGLEERYWYWARYTATVVFGLGFPMHDSTGPRVTQRWPWQRGDNISRRKRQRQLGPKTMGDGGIGPWFKAKARRCLRATLISGNSDGFATPWGWSCW